MSQSLESRRDLEQAVETGRLQSRYQRRSGGLPRLGDQPDADFSLSTLPKPVAEPSGPVAMLRILLSV